MLIRLAATGLNQKTSFDFKLAPDLNILTGRNGSGKTTVLKLLWYVISGNLERIIPEITFNSIELEATQFSIKLKKTRSEKKLRVDWIIDGNRMDKEVAMSEAAEFLNKVNHDIVKVSKTSVFFPTFRRIEGGVKTARTNQDWLSTGRMLSRGALHATDDILQEAMALFANRLTVVDRKSDNYHHRFVASISTNDIVDLLTKQYAENSEKTNKLHTSLSAFITEQISDYSEAGKRSKSRKLQDVDKILKGIQAQVKTVSGKREGLLRPFTILSTLIGKIFQYRGIRLTESITLGESKAAILSDTLSAGEKQMLSFLCYNAFTNNGQILIDEPEISLHVDWQRILFPTLLQQGTGNQFIIATHSPFIYSRYHDKELILGADKGGE